MAFVSERGNGYIIRVTVDGGEKKISGFTSKREAERTCDKIEALVTVQKTGDMPASVAVWVAEVAAKSPKLHKRLAALGLVEPPEEKHTLGELIQAHRASQQGVIDATLDTYDKIAANLIEFFGAGCELDAINRKRADDFAVWLRTAPLNRRNKKAVPYSTATVNRRISMTKQLFHYAKRIDWVADNPFEFIKGGKSVNPERWEYVEAETVLKVLEGTHLAKWRAIIALGRFAGVRGSSELYGLLWEHVHWSSPGEAGHLIIMAEKNKRHGRKFRTIPMHPIVERELSTLFDRAAEGEPHVFPGMKKDDNTSTMTTKLILRAGVPVWLDPWKNLRKSFCSDLMQIITDPVAYEKITDHTPAMAMEHYQIPHAKRLQDGYEKVLQAWGCSPTPDHPAGTPATSPGADAPTDEMGRVLGRMWDGFWDAQCSAPSGDNAQQDSQVLVFSHSPQETKKPCDFTQGLELGDTGREPNASDTVNYGVSRDSSEGMGRVLGRMGEKWDAVERNILELFSSLTPARRRWLVERLAEKYEN